jgi:hypothetical protein
MSLCALQVDVPANTDSFFAWEGNFSWEGALVGSPRISHINTHATRFQNAFLFAATHGARANALCGAAPIAALANALAQPRTHALCVGSCCDAMYADGRHRYACVLCAPPRGLDP